MSDFEQLIAKRRSIYNLGTNVDLSPAEIETLIKSAVKHCPTPFNSQSGRIALLFGQASQKLWNITEQQLQKITPPEKFSATQTQIASFAAGMGTVLFFIDDDVTKNLQNKFPLYAEQFAVWAEQAQGMLQYIVWTLLAEHHIGASLQHYNPLIDADVRHSFDTPQSWRLTAQMPFGSIELPADDKSSLPLEQRIKIFSN